MLRVFTLLSPPHTGGMRDKLNQPWVLLEWEELRTSRSCDWDFEYFYWLVGGQYDMISVLICSENNTMETASI